MTISALLLAAAATLTPGVISEIHVDTAMMGVIIPDQWGNDWIEVSPWDSKRAVVKVYGCNGEPRNVGEVPASSLNRFEGFRPYANASMSDLETVWMQREHARCVYHPKDGEYCEPAPRRTDCRVMEVPSGHGTAIHQGALDWFKAAHPERKFP